MKDVKAIVAKNLNALRKKKGITQAQLAEKFNYSDKAVCRWEGGETLPDINVLYALAEFYGVTMNDLVDHSFSPEDKKKPQRPLLAYRVWTCLLICSVVWLLAALVFAFSSAHYWLAFIVAIPTTALVILVVMYQHLGVPGKIIVSSILSWTVIMSLHLHAIVCVNINAWHLYIVGVPLQAFLIHFFCVKKYKKKKDEVIAEVETSEAH